MITEKIINKASRMASGYDRISASYFQRTMSLPYVEAVKLLNELEARGVVGPANGTYPREVLKIKNKKEPITIPSWIVYIVIGYLFWSFFYLLKLFLFK